MDDCSYAEAPRLRLVLEDCPRRFERLTSLERSCEALLALEYNELGFKESDVRALCDIAQSTKAWERGPLLASRWFLGVIMRYIEMA